MFQEGTHQIKSEEFNTGLILVSETQTIQIKDINEINTDEQSERDQNGITLPK